MADWKYHCEVLSVSESASLSEIKQAYRKLALRIHPDRNGGTPRAKEKFQQLNASYKYLVRNISSRPPPVPPSHTRPTPPPPPPQVRRERAGRPARRIWWETLTGFLASKPPAIPWAAARNFLVRNRELILQTFPAATAVLAASLSIYVFVSHSNSDTEGARAPASATAPDAKRVVGPCRLLSFQGGNLVARSEMEFSEWDCELECMRWFQTHEKQDGSCLWKGNEFRQHIGSSSQASSEAVNPPEPTTAKPAENPAPPASIQVNVGSGEVETETIPLTVYHLKLGSTIPIFFDFVPTIWVDSPRLIQVIAGKDGHYILVTAKRREPPFVSTIIVADQSGAATRKIIVFVE